MIENLLLLILPATGTLEILTTVWVFVDTLNVLKNRRPGLKIHNLTRSVDVADISNCQIMETYD